MERSKRGNALVMVLLATSVGSILAIMSAKTIIWSADYVYTLTARERMVCAAQGLVRCGMARAARDFELICKAGTEIQSIVCVDDQTYIVRLEPHPNEISISCALTGGTGPGVRVSARICKNEQGQIHVRGFQR